MRDEMSQQNEAARPVATTQNAEPTVRPVSIADINEAWAQGLRDFRAAPAYGLVFGGLYAAGGIAIVPVSYTHLTLPTNREV